MSPKFWRCCLEARLFWLRSLSSEGSSDTQPNSRKMNGDYIKAATLGCFRHLYLASILHEKAGREDRVLRMEKPLRCMGLG